MGDISVLCYSYFCFKVKISQTTERNSILLPTSGVAFLIYSVQDMLMELPRTSSQDSNVEQACKADELLLLRIKNFASGKAFPIVYTVYLFVIID